MLLPLRGKCLFHAVTHVHYAAAAAVNVTHDHDVDNEVVATDDNDYDDDDDDSEASKQTSKQASKQAEKQTVRLLSGCLFYCQIPEGIVCPGRIKTKPFPTMPNRFSLIGEVLDHDRQVVTYMEVRRPSCPPHPELLLFAG